MCPHSVSAYCYTYCYACVLILLYTRAHTAIYLAPPYCYISSGLIPLFMCPHTAISVSGSNLQTSNSAFADYVASATYLAPHTSYCYISRVLIPLFMCLHTATDIQQRILWLRGLPAFARRRSQTGGGHAALAARRSPDRHCLPLNPKPETRNPEP